MKNWFRILSIPAIFATAALTVITLEIYLNFYLPDYSTFSGIVLGILLGASSAWYLVRRHMKNNFRAIQDLLDKQITGLSDEVLRLIKERQFAKTTAATYMTENNKLQIELKELKEFRNEAAKSIKELYGKMDEYLKEEPPAVIHIKGNEIGSMMDNMVEKMAV